MAPPPIDGLSKKNDERFSLSPMVDWAKLPPPRIGVEMEWPPVVEIGVEE